MTAADGNLAAIPPLRAVKGVALWRGWQSEKNKGQEALWLRGAQGKKAAAKREKRREAESADKSACATKKGAI